MNNPPSKSKIKIATAFIRHRLTQQEGINKLTNNFIISDHCLTVEEVADTDCERAVKWLDMECPMV